MVKFVDYAQKIVDSYACKEKQEPEEEIKLGAYDTMPFFCEITADDKNCDVVKVPIL